MTNDIEIKMSPLSQKLSSGSKTVQVDIYEDGEGGWLLEVIDEYNNSTVWNDPFRTDKDALTEVKKTILAEGIDALIGSPSDDEAW